MRSKNSHYDPAIDHLRAFAALMVMFGHGYEMVFRRFSNAGNYTDPVDTNPLYVFILESHTGVALFMVLSGYIFTRSAMGRSISYPAFMLNRFLRIYPLMVAILFVAIALHPELFSPFKFLRSLLLFYRLPGVDFGPLLEIAPWTAIFWTITPEFQFYLIFPLLMFLFSKYGKWPLIMLWIAALLARFFVAIFLFDIADISYSTIYGRIDQFLLGMLAAIWTRGQLPESRLAIWLFPVACVVVLVMLLIFHYMAGPIAPVWWRAVWPTIEGAGWVFFTTTYLAISRYIPRWPAMCLLLIGEASYSIYLLHQAVFTFLYWQAGNLYRLSPLAQLDFNLSLASVLVVGFFLAPIVIGISMVTYRLIEWPFLNFRVRYLRDRMPLNQQA